MSAPGGIADSSRISRPTFVESDELVPRHGRAGPPRSAAPTRRSRRAAPCRTYRMPRSQAWPTWRWRPSSTAVEQPADRGAAEAEASDRQVRSARARTPLGRIEWHRLLARANDVDADAERIVSSSPRSTGQNAERAEPSCVCCQLRSASRETLGDRRRPSAGCRPRTLLPGGPQTMADLLACGRRRSRRLERPPRPRPISPRPAGPSPTTDLLAPVPRPGKIVAIGRNYREHAAEEGVDPPTAPLIFSKWPSSVVGHRSGGPLGPGSHGPGRLRGGARRRHRHDGSPRRGRRCARPRPRLHLPQRRVRP